MKPQTRRFSIGFDRAYRLLSSALFIRPSESLVEIAGERVSVRMAWAFRAQFPKASVASAAKVEITTLSRGVHGFAGQWLVNGSGKGIVALDFEPVQRGFVVGFPVKLRRLLVSVDEPDSLVSALRQ